MNSLFEFLIEPINRLRSVTLAVMFMAVSMTANASNLISLSMHDTELSKVMEMLSKQQRVNVLLTGDVGGEVSFNLYDVTVDQAIRSIAAAAGYAVEVRDGSYFIINHDDAGKYAPDGVTLVRSFEVRYANPFALEETLKPYLSSYGTLTLAPDRRLVIVEDTPEFVSRIESLLKELDRKPTQIMIEAKILEVTLDDEDTFGVDWSKLFNSDGGNGSFGVAGLAQTGAPGFFFDFATPNVEATLNALSARGRVRTLSTPKLLALQNQEASVIIGDRRGYQVTTTINQVTTESIEFLESGVILRVIPNVDDDGNVMLDIHPEVSNGTVDISGIPSQTTTEVTTQLIVPDGNTVFIGGLMKHTLAEIESGVPVLGKLPGVGRLFSNSERSNVNTETVVLITPRIVSNPNKLWNHQQIERVESHSDTLDGELRRMHSEVNRKYPATRVDLSRYQSFKINPSSKSVSVRPSSIAHDDSDFTLYLFHCYSKESAEAYAASFHNDQNLQYQSTDGGERYLMVYGRYATESEARTALLSVPSGIAKINPHVRKMSELVFEGS